MGLRKQTFSSLFKSNGQKWVILTSIAGFLAAIGLALVLASRGINVLKPILGVRSGGVVFEEKRGSWPKVGEFSTKVTQITSIGDNDHIVPSIVGCKDMMVVDLEFWINNPSKLQTALLPPNTKRVKKVEVFGQRIIIHRACIADDRKPFRSFSTWEQVWQEVRPVLEREFQ